MKTKWTFLMILALLAMLVGGNVAPARAQDVVTILPETLPDGSLFVWYEQVFSLSGGSGQYIGTDGSGFPSGLTFFANPKVDGSPNQAGEFHPTVYIKDTVTNVTYQRTYTLNIPKGTPTIVFADSYTLPVSNVGEPFTIRVHAHYVNVPGTWTQELSGHFAFYLDGATTPVAGCESLYDGTLPDGSRSRAECSFPNNLDVGEHTISVDFTPDETNNYNNASGTVQHTIGYYIKGYAFNDQNRDGLWNIGEPDLSGVNLKLDKDCDGTYEGGAFNGSFTTWSDGYFVFNWLYPDVDYCLMLDPATTTNYVQTTYTDPIYLDGNKNLELGAHWLNFALNPEIPPTGTLGEAYSQQFTAVDGTPPYEISLDAANSRLPAGISWDDITDTLSGTPTEMGLFGLHFHAEDSATPIHTISGTTHLRIIGDGSFELTSSPNPSQPGAEVTFELSATGSALVPGSTGYQAIPPIGTVTFFDGETAIDGCSGLYVNWNTSGVGPAVGDYPAVCKTSSLAEGQHTITASFTDGFGLYNNATVSLPPGQMVGYFYQISGTFFNDANYNKLMDVGETGLAGKYVYVSHCDGTNTLQAGLTDEFGAYTTFPLPAGQCYTIFSTLNALPSGYAYTVFPPQIASLSGPMTGMNIGAALMAFDPAGFPDGMVGVPYNATVTPLGGIGPFTITYIEGPILPAGLTTSFDSQTGAMTLSGTPTETQTIPFFFEAHVNDSVGSEFRFGSYYQILPGVSADLSLTKTDSKDPVKPGAQLVYALTVTNLGPDAAQTVTLVDTLDRNTKYVSVAAPKGWKCTYANYAVTCTGASLASGGSAVIKITVTVNKTAKAGKELVNNATVSCVTYDPVMLNNTVVQKTLVAK